MPLHWHKISLVNTKNNFFWTENLTPSELKKIKRKQRKAQKKAELEREKQKAEQEKRDQNKNKAADGELDGPKEEELVPDKLARVGPFIWMFPWMTRARIFPHLLRSF